MTHYRAQPEDDAVLIVLCAVRDGQFGKSALNEVIDLWVAGQIGRTDSSLSHQLAGVEERDEMAALLTEAVRSDYGTSGWRERAIKAGCLIPGER